MALIDILSAPWAITPDKYTQLLDVYSRHAEDPSALLAEWQRLDARSASPAPIQGMGKPYQISNGVAIVDCIGVMARRANLMQSMSGGVSTELLQRNIQMAVTDPEVRAVVLRADSPGGECKGIATLGSRIRAADSVKPILAFADGDMASAAYWIGSAAREVFAADSTSAVGSIGVVATHVDVSKAQDAEGIKTTEIFAGKYKRVASAYAPLSKEGKAALQDMVDYHYQIFVEAVAQFRGVSTEAVLATMADGRVFFGQQAVDAGLVDGIQTLDEVVSRALSHAMRGSRSVNPLKGEAVNEAEMRAQHPAVVQAIEAAAEQRVRASALGADEKLRADAQLAGAQAERERITSVRAQVLPGHEALIETLAMDGKTTGPDAAAAVLAAEKASRTAAAQAQAEDSPKPIKSEQLSESTGKLAVGAPDGYVVAQGGSALDQQVRVAMGEDSTLNYTTALSRVLKARAIA